MSSCPGAVVGRPPLHLCFLCLNLIPLLCALANKHILQNVVVTEFLKAYQFPRILLWAPNLSGSSRETIEFGTTSETRWVTFRVAFRKYYIYNSSMLLNANFCWSCSCRAAQMKPAMTLSGSSRTTPEKPWTSKPTETPTIWTSEVRFCWKTLTFYFTAILFPNYLWIDI